ncbi:MAG TPA: hypothetical protein VJ881_00415 [Halanaerobiales bacterium]|nr:hypothetical protein [Halanaerobiales bacterium]
MKIFNKKYIILMISIFMIFIMTESAYMVDWQDYKEQNINNLKNDISLKKEVIYNYNLAISYANLGEITNSQNTLDKIERKFGKNKFNKIIYPYIKEIDYNNTENLLDLNYAAFYYLINENYTESSKYFNQIITIEPKNVWAINYLAGNYIILEKYKIAENLLIKADNIKSNEFTNLLYGYIYYEKGNYLKAFSKFSKTGNLIEENILE